MTLMSTGSATMIRPVSMSAAAHPAVPHLKAFDGFSAAEPVWRALEREAVFPAYQQFDVLALWQRHIGAPAGVEPLIVAGFDHVGRPALLLPLGWRRVGPFCVAEALGGKHVNYNFGLWRREVAEALDAAGVAGVADLVFRIGRLGPRLDLLSIERQPARWQDVPNPLRLLANQPTPSFSWRSRLERDAEACLARLQSSATRKKTRHRMRRLADLPGFRLTVATDCATVDRLLDAHFVQKAARMRAAGVANVFAEPGVEAFLRAAARTGAGAAGPRLECWAMECDAEVLSVIVVMRDARRVSGMLVSVTSSDLARYSPGVILFNHILADACARGADWFDLGVGEASYKAWFCDEAEPLFDSHLALSPAGRLLATAQVGACALKRKVKQSPRLWTAMQSARRRLFGKEAAGAIGAGFGIPALGSATAEASESLFGFCDADILRVEAIALPADHAMLSLMVKIGERVRDLLMAPGAADVFRWVAAV